MDTEKNQEVSASRSTPAEGTEPELFESTPATPPTAPATPTIPDPSIPPAPPIPATAPSTESTTASVGASSSTGTPEVTTLGTPPLAPAEAPQPQYRSEYATQSPTEARPPTYTQYPEYASSTQQAQPTQQPAYQQPQYQQAPQYHYPEQRRGLPMAAWLGGGALLLALIIVGVVVLGLALSGSKPADTVRNFYTRIGNHDYTGGLSLWAPGSTDAGSAERLKQSIEGLEAQTGGRLQGVDVVNVVEQGDTATAQANIKLANGQTDSERVTMRMSNNVWKKTNIC